MKTISAIFVLFVLLIMATACDQGAVPSPDMGDGTSGDTDAALNDALNNLGDSQENGEGDGKGSDGARQKVKEAAAAYVEETLNDPAAMPQRILDVLSTVQHLGLEEEYQQELMDKLKAYYKDKAENYVYCKKDLLDLLGKCQAFGFNDLAAYTEAKAKGAPWCDSKVERVYSYKSGEFGTTMDFKITAEGMLKEYTVFGYANPDVRQFYFTMGIINWEYVEETKESCMVTRKISGGSENLTGYKDGSFSIGNDGSYWGSIINKDVIFKIEKIKVPPPPPNPDDPFAEDSCDDVQGGISEEKGAIEIPIEGKTDNPKHFTGTYTARSDPLDEEREQMGVSSDVTTWDININYLVDEIKKMAMGG